MSVDIIPTVTIPTLQRLRSSRATLTESNIIKCGEVFVTNSADKWSFYCSHCQLSTNDIGVFVCHIRLQHLPEQITVQAQTQPSSRQITIASSRQNVAIITLPPANGLPMENLLPSVSLSAKDNEYAEQIQSDIVREEPTVSINQTNIDYEAICSKVAKIVDMSSLTEPESSNKTSSSAVIDDKNTTTGDEEEIEEEFVEIAKTPKQELNEYDLQFLYENVETIMDDDNDDMEKEAATDNSLTETEDESREYLATQSSKYRHEAETQTSKDLLPHICPICHVGFKYKMGVQVHISKKHEKYLRTKLPYKCTECNKAFKSSQGLKYHSNCHNDKRKEYKCDMCHVKFYKHKRFLTHVAVHKNANCFPCQECGQFFDSNRKRIKHWKTHAKEKPFGCTICYRRFPRQQYLTHHLKSHNLYQCHFCPDEFNSKETQHIPYVCPKCDQLPDIQQKAEHLRRLACKSHVFESDEDN